MSLSVEMYAKRIFAPEGKVQVQEGAPTKFAPMGLYKRSVLSTMSVIWVNCWQKMMARRFGLLDSRAASTNIVSVFNEPAAPPKKRMSAVDSRAAFCAAVLGDVGDTCGNRQQVGGRRLRPHGPHVRLRGVTLRHSAR